MSSKIQNTNLCYHVIAYSCFCFLVTWKKIKKFYALELDLDLDLKKHFHPVLVLGPLWTWTLGSGSTETECWNQVLSSHPVPHQASLDPWKTLETKNIKVGHEKKVFVHQISLDHDIISKEALWSNNSKQMGFDNESRIKIIGN